MTASRSLPPADAPLPPEDPRPWLSALADGQDWAAPQALRHWRDDAEARRTWHAYQLIGDVMRSDELAQPAARDQALLARVRARLAEEPVVLAPPPRPATPAEAPMPSASLPVPASPRAARLPREGLRWLVPAGLAASLVLGSAWLILPDSDDGSGEATPVAAAAPGRADGLRLVTTAPGAAAQGPAATAGTDGVIRDPRLEEFLRAHRSARGGMALPGGGLRRVDAWVAAGVPAPSTP